ncbi:MAG: hypothetical protein E7496_10195 [Ruminococcus sp.]|nr:hypothetical protein [Ruminococcus sp.]
MEQNQFRKNAYDMIELVRCAVNGEVCDKKRTETMHPEELFKVCQKHVLTACVAYGLETAGIKYHQFTQAKEKSIRKNILFDAERKKILQRLEQEKIWYMPLKGALLKDWYPRLGMRQMSDNDILYDSSYRLKVKEIMLDLGFTCSHYEEGNDDAYFKPPVCNFEMHHELFTVKDAGNLHEYYASVKEKLLKDDGNDYGYHFRTEDFYLYITAHEYKHYADGGTGVRSLLDTYIFMRKFGDSLDWDYLTSELKKMQIDQYEQQSRELALKVFSGREPLTEEEASMLDYYIFSGTYGTLITRMKHGIENTSKAKYIFERIFPSMKEIEVYHTFFYRHKYLIPVLWIIRPFKGLTVKRKKLFSEISYLTKKKK